MASDVKWIKITTDIFDDEKVLMIESMPSSDSIIVIWFKLLVLAGKQNNSGVFIMNNRIAYTDEMLASIFRRDIGLVRLALATFEQFGMIEIVDDVITIPNWGKHQTLDSYEKKKERDRLYQAQRRAKQKLLVEESSDTSPDASADPHADASLPVAVSDIEEDKDIDISTSLRSVDIGGDAPAEPSPKAKKPAVRFVPPALEEVAAYVAERHSRVDPQEFIDFYASKGWMVGKSPMKDWRAACRNAEKWDRWNRKPAHGGGNVFMDMLREEEPNGTQ